MERLKSPFPWFGGNGDNPLMRIALCGYDGEHVLPESWECLEWKARGGYGSQGTGAGRENAGRERIWFSPHCIRQVGLFDQQPLGPMREERL